MQQPENTPLDYKKTLEPSAIQQIIEQYLITPPDVVEQILNFEAKQLINLYGKKYNAQHVIPEKEKPQLYAFIEQCIKNYFTFVVDDTRLLTYIMLISQTPGNAIIYLWHLQYMCHKLKIKHVNLNNYVEKIMPRGKFKAEVLEQTWQAQKIICRPSSYIESDNLFDYTSAGSSIREIF